MGDAEIINELKRLSSVVTSLEGVIVELQTSNTSLVNMIAEQVASNVNLAAMIVEQTATNVNLADAITELQNQVALQTTTNANLTTQIATLTAITGQLVEVNTRALDEDDIPHAGLSDTFLPLVSNILNLNDNAEDFDRFTDGDWGVGLDYYPMGFLTVMHAAGLWLNGVDEGFNLLLRTVGGAHFFYEMFTPKAVQVTETDPNVYVVRFTRPIIQTRIQSGSTLEIEIENYSGAQISLAQTHIFGYLRAA